MYIELKEISTHEPTNINRYPSKGLYHNKEDDGIYYNDGSFSMFITDKTSIEPLIVNDIKSEENNTKLISEEFALKMLAIQQGKVKDLEL